jgi:hypothetical protein
LLSISFFITIIFIHLLIARRTITIKGFGVWGLGFGVWGLGFGVPIESRLTSLYPIQVNYSLIFRDVKSLNISKKPLLDNLAGHPKYSNSRFKLFENYDFEEIYSMNSIYSSFPLVQLVLLIPFLVYKFKRPNVTFVIGRLVSYWLVLPLMIVLLFISSSPRILSAFGIL